MGDSEKTYVSQDVTISVGDRLEQLAAELRRQWNADNRVKIESLPGFHHIAPATESLLDLIYHEVLIREQFGEHPTVAQFESRFPEHADQLRRLFAVHQSVENDSNGDASARSALGSKPFADDIGDEGFGTGDQHFQADMSDGIAGEGLLNVSPQRLPLSFAPRGYELLEEVGRGGMAIVFRARHRKLHRVVALKMLLPGSHATPELLGRLEQEAKAVAQLQHAAIVQIHEIGEHDGLPFLALEFIAGGTLKDWLEGRPLPAVDAASITEQLAATIAYAHERGIVHRDLKPANVLLVSRPPGIDSPATARISTRDVAPRRNFTGLEMKISDFGLARISEAGSELTATGQIIGTPSYMSPEQAAANVDSDATPSQDIYSLGAILYELLTGRPPFRGTNVLDTLDQVRHEDPISPRRLQPRIPKDIETICLKCLEKSPARRYGSAETLSADLKRFLGDKPIAARPVSVVEHCARLIRRHPAIALLTIAMIVIMAGGFGAIVREAERANESEFDLRIQRDEAERMRKLAVEERDAAIKSKLTAEVNLQQAIEAVESLSAVGEHLRAIPHQQKISKEIFNSTVRFYEGFLVKQGDDSKGTHRFARALVRAAEFSGTVGDRTQAEEQLSRAITLLLNQNEKHPNDAYARGTLAFAYWVQGNLFQAWQRFDVALLAYRNCVLAVDEYASQSVTNADGQSAIHLRANAMVHEACVLRRMGNRQKAIIAFETAIAELRQLSEKNPERAAISLDLTRCLTHYGSALREADRNESSAQILSDALRESERLMQNGPLDGERRALCSFALYAGAMLDLKESRDDAALGKLRRADEILVPLVSDFPSVFEYRFKLSAVLSQEVVLQLEADDVDTAMLIWSRLSQHLDSCFERFPRDLAFARWIAKWTYAYGDFLLVHERQVEAESSWAKAIDAGEVLLTSKLIPAKERVRTQINQARRLALLPRPTQRQRQRALALAKAAAGSGTDDPRVQVTLGLAYFENDNFEAAETALNKGRRTLRGFGGIEQGYLAMTLSKLGKPIDVQDSLLSIPGEKPGQVQNAALLKRVAARSRLAIVQNPSSGEK